MSRQRLKSPLAQAVVPVAAGMGVLALIGVVLWVIALVVSHSSRVEVRLGDKFFDAGPAKLAAARIAKEGPILYPGLIGQAGKRPIGISHVGSDELKGWRVYSLIPPGAAADCVLAVDRASGELAAPCAPARYPADGTGLDLLPITKVTIDPDKHLIIDLTTG